MGFYRKYVIITAGFRPPQWRAAKALCGAILSLEDSGMSKTKTHPDLGGKIGELYGGIFPKKPRIEDFRIRVESGRFTGFSGRGFG